MCFGSDLMLVCAVVGREILPTSNTSITQAPTRFKGYKEI